jgi:hypothetical protein
MFLFFISEHFMLTSYVIIIGDKNLALLCYLILSFSVQTSFPIFYRYQFLVTSVFTVYIIVRMDKSLKCSEYISFLVLT